MRNCFETIPRAKTRKLLRGKRILLLSQVGDVENENTGKSNTMKDSMQRINSHESLIIGCNLLNVNVTLGFDEGF
jgi:hypothetical protein